MKKNIFVVLLISISSAIVGQGLFTKTYHTEETHNLGQINIDNSGNYLVSGAYRDLTTNLGRPFIYKINKNGELIDTARYFGGFQNHIYIDELIPFNNYYIVLASITEENYGGVPIKSLVYMKIDTNLNLINTKYYYLLDNSIIYATSSQLDKDSNIIMNGWYIVPTGYVGSFITKLSIDGDSLATHIIPADSIREFTALHVDSNYYYSFSSDLWDQNIYKYDTNLTLVSKTEMPKACAEKFTPVFINDSVYYTSGWRYIAGYKEYGIMKASLKGTLFNSVKFGIVDSANTLANTEALCKSGDYLYLYGNPYTSSSLIPYGNGKPSWNYIAKLDTNLNIIWEKLYGGDAFYMAVDITVDTDGGLLLLSTRNDLYDGVNQLDVHLMKIDTAGNAVWVNDIKIREIGVDIFPNPTSSQLNITLNSPNKTIYQLQIKDLQGKQILQKQINAKQTKLDVSNLSKGIYILEGSTNTGESFSRKFVKE